MLENKYSKWYFNIINSYNSLSIPENIYCENHHIMPKCIEVNNSSENIIRVRMKDHVILHHLLTKMFGGNIKRQLQTAYYATVILNKIKCSPLQIERARNLNSEAKKGTKLTEETKQKISKGMKGKYEDIKNPMWGTTWSEKRKKEHSEKMKEKTFTEKHRQNLSKARKGKCVGEKSNSSKLIECQVVEIRKLYTTIKTTQKKLADMFGVSMSCIQAIIERRTWKHI